MNNKEFDVIKCLKFNFNTLLHKIKYSVIFS